MKHKKLWIILGGLLVVALIAVVVWSTTTKIYQVLEPITASPADCERGMRFAVIGDWEAGGAAADVSDLVHSWDVDLILTTGDNNPPNGTDRTIDRNIGQYYADFISPYHGEYGSGAAENRFFPALGNHDWNTETLQPYYDYFDLPGNERYYDFQRGAVHFFILDSDEREPDGNTQDSVQAAWFRDAITDSTLPWQLVLFHHPPYSSSASHGSEVVMRWPFAEWGADAVINGHAHLYERLSYDQIPYFVNGLSGRWKTVPQIHRFNQPLEGSQVRYNQDYGAQLVTANETCINFSFFNRDGELIDSYTVRK